MDWKEEFRKLFITNDKRNLEATMRMKKEYIPDCLYRYRPLSTQKNFDNLLSEIRDGKIYLGNPSEFNDPFDCCSLLKKEDVKVSRRLKEEFYNRFKPLISDPYIDEIFKDNNWHSRLMDFIALNISIDENIPREEAYQRVELMNWKMFESVNNKFNELIASISRVACFSESLYNLPMWNHYASAHEGVCLEYSTECIKNNILFFKLFPVFYVKELPNAMQLYFDGPLNVTSEYLLLHKLEDWKYEKEWRLILTLYEWYSSIEEIPVDEYKNGKIIDFFKPSKIFLGYKIGKFSEEYIRLVGKEFDIPVVKMGRTEYGLKAGI